MKSLRQISLITAVIVCSSLLVSCHPRRLGANEELKLAPGQVQIYTKKAEEGDAAAAKKLWHHYTFAVGDLQEGKKWKTIYDDLNSKSKKETSPK